MKSLRKRATYFSLNQFEVEVEVEVERFLECARIIVVRQAVYRVELAVCSLQLTVLSIQYVLDIT